MDDVKTTLRYLGLETLCLIILTSPIWAALLAVHFTLPVIAVFSAIVAAAVILLIVRGVSRRKDACDRARQ